MRQSLLKLIRFFPPRRVTPAERLAILFASWRISRLSCRCCSGVAWLKRSWRMEARSGSSRSCLPRRQVLVPGHLAAEDGVKLASLPLPGEAAAAHPGHGHHPGLGSDAVGYQVQHLLV